MGIFITEDWLRSHTPLSDGAEICLPADARLTPAARGLILDRRISVKYEGTGGPLFEKSGEFGKSGEMGEGAPHDRDEHADNHVERPENAPCSGVPASAKPDTMTHLNAHTLVPKNNPCLLFRGQLDSAIALAVWLQVETEGVARDWLDDIRSVLGKVMRAEVQGDTLAPFAIGGLDAGALHLLSHNPLHTLGHDHLVPEAAHGRTVAMLNLLRTKIREAELAAAAIFIHSDFSVSRPDIMQGLNRLSSAVYVLMILSALAHGGKPWPSCEQLETIVEKVRNEA